MRIGLFPQCISASSLRPERFENLLFQLFLVFLLKNQRAVFSFLSYFLHTTSLSLEKMFQIGIQLNFMYN